MLGVGASGPLADDAGRDEATAPSAVASTDDDPYAAERDAWIVLTAVHGLGPIGFAALLARYRTGRGILASAAEPGAVERLAATPSLERSVGRAERRPIADSVAEGIVRAADDGAVTLARVRRLGLRVVTVEEPAYPPRLARIAMPPHALFVLGDTDALSPDHAVAIVGTRRATVGGRTTAGRIATALVHAGSTVVSGLAYGIDGAAHEATVRAGGTTVAVIGGGHAVLSPPSHARLAEAIVASGGAVVSEHAPDVVPTHGTFPRRNRIISGLSDATVVVEAPARSGALITASWALEQGRECFLVPGPLDSPASSGCLSFLREFEGSAHLVAGIPQLLADLGFGMDREVGTNATPASAASSTPGSPGDDPATVLRATIQALGTTEGLVARQLVEGRVTVDEIVAASGLAVATVLATLALLERRGLAVGVHGRYRPAGSLLAVPRRSRTR